MKRVIIALAAIELMGFASFSRAAESEFRGTTLEGVSWRSPAVQSATPSEQSRRDVSAGEGPALIVPVTLFRFDPRYGDIAVQPVLGRINGAQFLITW